ncbi:hypothetical protein C8Q79DRAFT_932478 [Trametes meyenii]|nr:hypothetical protein C8Q79DRAFT_932478 [Trametes meyenii]
MPSNKTDKLPQQSLASDDAGIMTAVAAQMQNSWEKKRREKETRFLHGAKADLDKCIAGRLEEFSTAIADLNTAYEKFVFEYAQADDNIRKLWLQLQHEQNKLLILSEKKHKTILENDGEREKGQVKGMAIAKKAVEDFGNLISSLEEL